MENFYGNGSFVWGVNYHNINFNTKIEGFKTALIGWIHLVQTNKIFLVHLIYLLQDLTLLSAQIGKMVNARNLFAKTLLQLQYQLLLVLNNQFFHL